MDLPDNDERVKVIRKKLPHPMAYLLQTKKGKLSE